MCAIGTMHIVASEFIPWIEGCEICRNAVGMTDFQIANIIPSKF